MLLSYTPVRAMLPRYPSVRAMLLRYVDMATSLRSERRRPLQKIALSLRSQSCVAHCRRPLCIRSIYIAGLALGTPSSRCSCLSPLRARSRAWSCIFFFICPRSQSRQALETLGRGAPLPRSKVRPVCPSVVPSSSSRPCCFHVCTENPAAPNTHRSAVLSPKLVTFSYDLPA